MRRTQKRGPGPSHLLLTPDHAGNVVGIDPHKQTLTATVVDARGGVVASEHFRVSGGGHRAAARCAAIPRPGLLHWAASPGEEPRRMVVRRWPSCEAVEAH